MSRSWARRGGVPAKARVSLLTGIVLLALASLPNGVADARGLAKRHAACVHRGGPGVIGTEALIEKGWTTGETDELVALLPRFWRKVCPAPGFLDIDGASIYQKHVDHETVWQYSFRVTTDRHGHYTVIAQLLDIFHMRITVESHAGKVLYRSGIVHTE